MPMDQWFWTLVGGGLTAVGLVVTFFVFRGRGAAAGFRMLGWSLLPLAAALSGLVALLFRIGHAVTAFVGSFALSPRVWAGLAMFLLSFFLLGGAAFARRRRAAKAPAERPEESAAARGQDQHASARQTREVGKGRPAAKQGDDPLAGFEDVEQILKNRGIS